MKSDLVDVASEIHGGSGWAISDDPVLVVYPLNDSRIHDITYDLESVDLTLHCWCRPDYKDGVIIHHSADGREVKE